MMLQEVPQSYKRIIKTFEQNEISKEAEQAIERLNNRVKLVEKRWSDNGFGVTRLLKYDERTLYYAEKCIASFKSCLLELQEISLTKKIIKHRCKSDDFLDLHNYLYRELFKIDYKIYENRKRWFTTNESGQRIPVKEFFNNKDLKKYFDFMDIYTSWFWTLSEDLLPLLNQRTENYHLDKKMDDISDKPLNHEQKQRLFSLLAHFVDYASIIYQLYPYDKTLIEDFEREYLQLETRALSQKKATEESIRKRREKAENGWKSVARKILIQNFSEQQILENISKKQILRLPINKNWASETNLELPSERTLNRFIDELCSNLTAIKKT